MDTEHEGPILLFSATTSCSVSIVIFCYNKLNNFFKTFGECMKILLVSSSINGVRGEITNASFMVGHSN